MQKSNFEDVLRRAPVWFVPALLLLVTFLLYANSFPGTFIQDDHHIVRTNPLVADLAFGRIFTCEYWQGIESSGLYRPLTILSLAVNQRLFGVEAWGYHLVNVLLQSGVAVLIWMMLPCWGFTRSEGALAGLLFAIHPLHTEVVDQIVGRGELLASAFLLLALICARSEGPRATARTCVCYLAALLSKEHAITFLILLPLLDTYVQGLSTVWRHRRTLYGALLAVTIVWLVWRQVGVIHEFPPTVLPPEVVPLAHLPWDSRLLTALLLQGLYLYKLVLPLNLQAVYAPPDLPAMVPGVFSFSGFLVLLTFCLLAGLILYGVRRGDKLGILFALYLASFALTANVFFAIGVTFAERLVYFPSVWFCAALAVVLCPLLRYRPGIGICVLYLLLLSGITLSRNRDFSSEERYWSADVRQNPRDYLALVNQAELLAFSGRDDEAEGSYRLLFELSPDFAYGYRSRTNYLIARGRFDEALDSSAQALNLARKRNDRTAMGYDLGDQARIHLERRDYAQALALLDESAGILGRNDFDLDLRGAALAGLGRQEEALQAFRQAANVNNTTVVQYPLALTLFRAGQLQEARAVLETILAKNSANAEAWNLLGVICAQAKDWPAAAAAFNQATAAAPANKHYLENLQRAQQSLPEGDSRGR